MALVTLDVAKAHLRLTGTTDDVDVQQKVDAASAIIVDYLQDRADDSWDEATAPLPVQMAVLLLVGALWRHRGDDPVDRTDLAIDKGVWTEIDPILIRFLAPVVR
jgi:hypothetical protein